MFIGWKFRFDDKRDKFGRGYGGGGRDRGGFRGGMGFRGGYGGRGGSSVSVSRGSGGSLFGFNTRLGGSRFFSLDRGSLGGGRGYGF